MTVTWSRWLQSSNQGAWTCRCGAELIRLESVDGRREKCWRRRNGDCVKKCLEVAAFWVVTLCRYISSCNYYLSLNTTTNERRIFKEQILLFCGFVCINNYSSSILALCTLHFMLVRLDVVVTERDGSCCCLFCGKNWEGELLHHQPWLNNRVDLFPCYHTSLCVTFLFLWKLLYTWSCCTSWQHIPLIR